MTAHLIRMKMLTCITDANGHQRSVQKWANGSKARNAIDSFRRFVRCPTPELTGRREVDKRMESQAGENDMTITVGRIEQLTHEMRPLPDLARLSSVRSDSDLLAEICKAWCDYNQIQGEWDDHIEKNRDTDLTRRDVQMAWEKLNNLITSYTDLLDAPGRYRILKKLAQLAELEAKTEGGEETHGYSHQCRLVAEELHKRADSLTVEVTSNAEAETSVRSDDSYPWPCSAMHGLHRCEKIKGHDGLCECHCGMKWTNNKLGGNGLT